MEKRFLTVSLMIVLWFSALSFMRLRGSEASDYYRSSLEEALADRAELKAFGEVGEAAETLLIGALEDDSVCDAAVKALGRIGDIRVISKLIEGLSSGSWERRRCSAEALGELKAREAVEPLIKLLKDENWDVRISASCALGKIGDKRAIIPLIEALLDKTWKAQWDKTCSALAEELKGVLDKRATESLLEIMKEGGGLMIKSPGDEGVLVIESPWEEVGWFHEAVAEALGKIGDRRAVGPLIGVLKEDEDWVRDTEMEALVKIGKPAVGPLIGLLGNEDEDLRDEVEGALKEMGEPLRKLIADNDIRLIGPFTKRLAYWWDKEEASKVLLALGWSPKTEDDKVHMWVAQHKGAILRKNWGMTKRVLLKDMGSGNEEITTYGIYSFIALGKEEIIPVLIEKLHREGTLEMAEAYMKCGQKRLHDAAKGWAKRQGWLDLATFSGDGPVKWGVLGEPLGYQKSRL